jgi:hypothetical protein
MALNPGTQRQLVDEHIGELERTARVPTRRVRPVGPSAVGGEPGPGLEARAVVDRGWLARHLGALLIASGERLGGLDGRPGWEHTLLGAGHGQRLEPGC